MRVYCFVNFVSWWQILPNIVYLFTIAKCHYNLIKFNKAADLGYKNQIQYTFLQKLNNYNNETSFRNNNNNIIFHLLHIYNSVRLYL